MTELPPLDVTDVERACAESLTEEEWLTQYAMASPIELIAIRYCRERQLLQALRERDEALQKMVDYGLLQVKIFQEQVHFPALAAANRRADEAEKAIREHNNKMVECECTQFIIRGF